MLSLLFKSESHTPQSKSSLTIKQYSSSIRIICIIFLRSLTYRVPSAFQLTLYGFCSKSLIFCLSMETGCAPGNPDLKVEHFITIMTGIHTKQYMSETNLTWVTHLSQCSPYHEINVNWKNITFHKNANKWLSFSWYFRSHINKILIATTRL